jgi:carboxyl-terminal processing protease
MSYAIDGMQAAFPGAQQIAIAGKTALQQNSTVGEQERVRGVLNSFGETFERMLTDRTSHPFAVRNEVGPQLVAAAINGMLSRLDPLSVYIDTKSVRDMQVQTRGEFGGIGVEVTMEDGLVKVVAPIDDTPAAKSGIRTGDIITHLDDEAVQGLTLNQVVEKMRGPVNTKIRLGIMRKGNDAPVLLAIVRDAIPVRSVRSSVYGDDIGYVRIIQFNEQTLAGLKNAIADISNQVPNDRLKGYVIDLRNNPGGSFDPRNNPGGSFDRRDNPGGSFDPRDFPGGLDLDRAVVVSDAFLERGEIVSVRNRDPEQTMRFNSRPGDLTRGKPLIVLINGGSASVSEIVAGALQDHRRATLVGTRSFGHGLAQTIIPLDSGGALRLTTARYFTPSGRLIHGNGIAPDIEVLEDGPFPYDRALKVALDLMRGIQTNPAFPPNPRSISPN